MGRRSTLMLEQLLQVLVGCNDNCTKLLAIARYRTVDKNELCDTPQLRQTRRAYEEIDLRTRVSVRKY